MTVAHEVQLLRVVVDQLTSRVENIADYAKRVDDSRVRADTAIQKSLDSIKSDVEERRHVERLQHARGVEANEACIVKWLHDVLSKAISSDGEVTSVFGAIEGKALRMHTKRGQMQVTVEMHSL